MSPPPSWCEGFVSCGEGPVDEALSHRPARQLGWLVELAGRNAAELVARGDVELQEDLAQVVLHRARADEELCADLRVRETVLREPGDLRLLGREHAARVVGAP